MLKQNSKNKSMKNEHGIKILNKINSVPKQSHLSIIITSIHRILPKTIDFPFSTGRPSIANSSFSF